MHNFLVAEKLHQISHMEILHEGDRPGARLRHLLGHISIYDSVERWRTEHTDAILASEAARRDAALLQLRTTKPACSNSSVDSPMKLHTLVQFQAAIRAHLDRDGQTTVHEKVFSDEGGEEEASWSDGDDPIMDVIQKGMGTKLRLDVRDEVVLYRSNSTAMKSNVWR